MGAAFTTASSPPPLLMFLADGSGRLNLPTIALLSVVLLVLAIAYIVGQVLRQQPETSVNAAVVRTFNRRVRAWWMMCAILVFGFLIGNVGTVVLFAFVSFWALREFITMTPTRRGDHRTLFWVFFLFTPLQYVLVGMGMEMGTELEMARKRQELYELYTILIPVYGMLFIPARIALSGDHKRFLERSAKIQVGLLICVYALSHAPALLALELTRSATPGRQPWQGNNFGLLFYFILIVQLGDVFQYICGRLFGRHVIAPTINASKTWEGFLGGILCTTLLGTLLWWVTPFQYWESACMSLIIAIMGFAGSMTMSAIKRDRGVADYGTLVQGHVGVLDRIDSICFAAPVFFHLTKYFFSAA